MELQSLNVQYFTIIRILLFPHSLIAEGSGEEGY